MLVAQPWILTCFVYLYCVGVMYVGTDSFEYLSAAGRLSFCPSHVCCYRLSYGLRRIVGDKGELERCPAAVLGICSNTAHIERREVGTLPNP